MKKITNILLVAILASFAFVACNKPANTPKPSKDNDTETPATNDDKDKPAEEVKLAVDGKFSEWEEVTPVQGGDGILLAKTQVTDDKLFFYLEIDSDAMLMDDVAFANYLTLCLDCTGEGAEKVTYWGGETGATYDKAYQIWLMTGGKASVSNWDSEFSGRAKLDNGVYKIEFSLARTTDLLKSKQIYFGAYLNDQSVEDEDGNENWIPGVVVGVVPEEGEDLAKVK